MHQQYPTGTARLFPMIFVFILLFFGCRSTKNQQPEQFSFARNTVVAHRGAWKTNQLPENSIPALREAIRLGCAGSEFDVRMTADDSLIVNHDPVYHGLEIEKVTYAQLLVHKLPNGDALPTLTQYLNAGMQSNNKTLLVLEIKPSGGGTERARLIADKVVALVHRLRAESRVVYISFDYEMLLQVKRQQPTASTQYLNGNKSPSQLKADGITGADYHLSVFRKYPHWITEARQLGVQLNAWTVNTAADMDWLLEQQFNFITTNEPELLLERVTYHQQKKETRNSIL